LTECGETNSWTDLTYKIRRLQSGLTEQFASTKSLGGYLVQCYMYKSTSVSGIHKMTTFGHLR